MKKILSSLDWLEACAIVSLIVTFLTIGAVASIENIYFAKIQDEFAVILMWLNVSSTLGLVVHYYKIAFDML
jgi:hypothetical protein